MFRRVPDSSSDVKGRVVVNCRFLTQPVTGVQRFAENLIRELVKIRHDLILVAPRENLRLTELSGQQVQRIGNLHGHLWEQFDLFRIAFENRALVLNLGNSAPLLWPNKISTLHDVTYKFYPSGYPRRLLWGLRIGVPLMTRSSRLILTVSQFSKNEIVRKLRVPSGKISVVYNAAADVFTPVEDIPRHDYAAVFNPGDNKNMTVLFDAFSSFVPGQLKLVGFKSQSKFANVPRNIVPTGRLTDAELANVYRSVKAIISPSLYEGFGLPVIEAQKSGTLVIASDIPVYREILRDSAVYFDPRSVEGLLEAIKTVEAISKDRYEEMREVSIRNADRFSWQTSAQLVSKLIDQALSE